MRNIVGEILDVIVEEIALILEKTTIEDEEIGARAAEIEDDPDLAPTTTDRSVTRVLCTVRIGLDKVSNSTVCPTECHLRRDILSSRVTADSTVTERT